MPEPKFHQVVYILHLPLEKALLLGRFTLWPYLTERDQRITEPGVRAYLDKLFDQMLDYRGQPLKHIALISETGAKPFEPLTDEAGQRMRAEVGALFLSAVVRNNPVLGAVSSENFNHVIQNFQPGSDEWATEDGSYIRTKVGGLHLSDAGLRLPGYIPGPDKLHYDEKLVQGCIECFASGKTDLADRIARSIRWVGYAYANADYFPYHNRILLMMIAFEILADQPDGFNQNTFGEWVDRVWGTAAYKATLDKLWAQGKGPFGQAGWWAVEYYRMRNAIIHKGDPHRLGSRDDFGREFFGTAVMVFAECIRQLLRAEGLMAQMSASDEIVRTWWLSTKEEHERGQRRARPASQTGS